MTLSITTDPLYPTAGAAAALTLAGAQGNRAELILSSKPTQSTLTLGTTFISGATFLHEQASPAWVPDVAGVYGFDCFDYYLFSGLAGEHAGDPIGKPRKKLLDSATGVTVNVTATMNLDIATAAGHAATLRLGIAGSVVRSAALVNPNTNTARAATLGTAVVAALAACVGVTDTALEDDLPTVVGELVTKYQAHRIMLAGVHYVADNTNAMLRGYTPASNEAAIATLNEMRAKLVDGHMLSGTSSTRWHQNDDTANLPIVGSASSLPGATVLAADIRYRVYERHRVTVSSVHGVADTTHTLTAAKPLSAVIVAYLDAIAALSPSAPSGEPSLVASHRFGMKP